jgi:hypothetical protein
MEIDEKKVIEWLKRYLVDEEVDIAVSERGIEKTIIAGINTLTIKGSFLSDFLRKDLSLYLKRIVSIEEFERIKNWGVC